MNHFHKTRPLGNHSEHSPDRTKARPVFAILWVVFCLGSFVTLLPAQTPMEDEIKLLQGLRQRRLYSLAIDHAKQQIAQLPIASDSWLPFQIELIKLRTAHCFEAELEPRLSLFNEIAANTDRLLRDHPDRSDIVLLDVQSAVAILELGILLRREIEAGADTPQRRNAAFSALRQCDRDFTRLDTSIGEMIPSRPRKTDPALLNQAALISLQNNIRHQKIRSKINRGLLYNQFDQNVPSRENSADNQLAIISSAATDLQKLIPLLEDRGPTYWLARLDLLQCLREISQFESADRLSTLFLQSVPPPLVGLQLKTEALRRAVARQNWKTAASLVASGRRAGETVSADYDLAVLEYLVSVPSISGEEDSASGKAEILKKVQQIETQHGAYWGRRANLLFLNTAAKGTTRSFEATIRVAQEHYRKRRFQEAIVDFEKASRLARSNANLKMGLELAFQAILIDRKLGRHRAVYDKSVDLSHEYRDLKRSAVIHHVGILSAADLVRSNQLTAKQYQSALNYHLETWPDEPSSQRVGHYLGNLFVARKEWIQASETFLLAAEKSLNLPSSDRLSMEIDIKLAKSLESIGLSQRKALTPFIERVKNSIIFRNVENKNQFPHAWAAFTICLEPSWLSSAESFFASVDPDSATLNRWFLRLACNAARGPDSLIPQPTLMDLAGKLPSAQQKQLLLDLQADLNIADSIRRTRLAVVLTQLPFAKHWEDQFGLLFAKAFIISRDNNTARQLLERAAQKKPKSREIHAELAQLLAQSKQKDDQTKALDLYRKLLATAPAGSNEWFSAKYSIAEIYFQTGNRQRSRQILKFLRESPRGWEESTLKDDFEDLLRRLDR